MSGRGPDQYGQRQQDPPGGYRPPPWPAQQGYQPPQQYQQPYQAPYAPPRKKRRVFLWVFLAIQALFIIWIATGVAGTSHSGTSAHAQAVTWCADPTHWQYLYKSQADCVTHYGNALNGASDIGKSIGAGLIIALWVVADFLLAVGYAIYRLASRPR